MQGVASYQPSLQGRIWQQKPAVRPDDTKVRHSMSVNAVLKIKEKDVQQQSNSYNLKFIISHKKKTIWSIGIQEKKRKQIVLGGRVCSTKHSEGQASPRGNGTKKKVELYGVTSPNCRKFQCQYAEKVSFACAFWLISGVERWIWSSLSPSSSCHSYVKDSCSSGVKHTSRLQTALCRGYSGLWKSAAKCHHCY